MDWIAIASDFTVRTVALGAACLGAVSGGLGSYAVLRKQSLLGDAISHAALPGIVLAFLLTGSKAPFVLVLGAALAGWIGTLLVMAVVSTTRVKEDSALGIVLSVFFGFGMVLLTLLQKRPDASQAGLDRFLFGQAATMLVEDVQLIVVLGAAATAVAALFWKEFKLLSFDPDFGATLGLPVRALDVLLTSVLVVAIVIGLQTVGVVLMSAMVVAPAAAARQWTDRLGAMMLTAALFGALSGLGGAVMSAVVPHLPTGPTVVLWLTAFVLLSLAFAPNRGLVWNRVRDWRSRERLRAEATLGSLHAMASQHADPGHSHSAEALYAVGGHRAQVRRNLAELARRGWVEHRGDDRWSITPSGAAEAGRSAAERSGDEEDAGDGA
jgi:manganese/zinc/iron transport system permease protein